MDSDLMEPKVSTGRITMKPKVSSTRTSSLQGIATAQVPITAGGRLAAATDVAAYAVPECVANTDSPGRSAGGIKDLVGEAPAKVRFNIDLSKEIAEFLELMSKEQGTTKSEIMRKAVSLLKIAKSQKDKNRSMGFIDQKKEHLLDTVVVGIL